MLFDIDGVLVVNGHAVKGSRNLLKMIRQNGLLVMLLTNDAQHSVEEKAAELRSCGIDVAPEEIVSCGDGLVELVQSLGLEKKPLFPMGSLGNPCYAEKTGLTVIKETEKLHHCDGVIIGEGWFDWKHVINSVLNFFISKRKSLFIVPNPDKYFPVGGGRISIGPRAIARFIQETLSSYGFFIEPVYLGRPYLPIFRNVHRRLEKKWGGNWRRGVFS